MSDLATASPTYGLTRSIEPPRGDINGFLRPSMGKIRKGAIMGRRAGSRLLEPVLDASARSDLEIIGCFDGIDSIPAYTDAGSNGEALDGDGLPVEVVMRDGALGRFDTGTGANEITADDIGQPCFAKNDNTLWLTDNGGTLSFAGIISGVAADGKIELCTDWRIRSLWKLTRTSLELVDLGASAPTELTIATGAVTVTQSNHTIDTEADAASDNLDTIAGMVADQIYLLRPASAARTVVIRDTAVSTTGNIRTPFAQSISLAEATDMALAVSDGTNVIVVGFRTLAADGGGAGAIIGLLSALTTADKSTVVAAINEVYDFATAAPAMQAANATLVAGTVTISAGITVAADSEVLPVLIGALSGTTNFGQVGELKASRVVGAPGVGTVVIQAYGDDGALDVDAAGAIRVVILTPQI
jgi:hypothetical protein